MTSTIEKYGRYIIIKNVSRKTAKLIDKATSYFVEGFFFAPAFKARRWDGKEHLLKVTTGGHLKLPSGMAPRVIEIMKGAKADFEIIDHREKKPCITADLTGDTSIVLRPYQEEAVEAFIAGDGPSILKMAIRSGKTLTGGAIAQRLKARTLFVVPSTLLLHQTAKSLKNQLGVEIGRIGDGHFEIQDITVGIINSLSNMLSEGCVEIEWLKKHVDFLILDEAHHAKADTWRSIALNFDTYWTLGLTATPPLPSGASKGHTKGGIWLSALGGEIAYEIGIKELIKGGYLVQPVIELHEIRKPSLVGAAWGKEMRQEGITLNPTRNGIVIKRAMEEASKGERVLITCALTEQVKELTRLFKEAGWGKDVPCVTGPMKTADRETAIASLVSRETPIIISTVMGEGVDIPEMEVMINAGGGKSHTGTIQRMRNLTKSEGKTGALIVDFIDYHNSYLADHTRMRLKSYRDEDAFKFKVVKYG